MGNLNEELSEILGYLPEIHKGEDPKSRLGWVWHVVQVIKSKVSYQKNYGIENDIKGLRKECGLGLWTPDTVRKAFMCKLFQAKLLPKERKQLVVEFNRALGGHRFPKDWPMTVCYTIDMLCPLPRVDRITFPPSPKPSRALQRLIAALYMVGTRDNRFMFAMNVYAKLMGCSDKTLCKFINRLCSLGYLEKVKQGYSSHVGKGKGKGTWYRVDDPLALLNLFWFTTTHARNEFVSQIASVRRQMDKVQWGDYVITPQWLFDNKMLSNKRWR